MENKALHSNLEKLLNSLIPFAQQMLEKHDEFYPFGMYINTKDEIVATGEDSYEDHPESQQVINSLIQIFQKQKQNILAAGIAFDSKIGIEDNQKSDAIAIQLEEKNGKAILAHLPYKKNNEKFEFGEMLFSKADSRFKL